MSVLITAKEIDQAFPNLAEWVKERGWIEIGDRDWQGFVVRLLDEGGFCVELGRCASLGEALIALEQRLPDVEE
jgi:hypothetical protein